MAFELPKLPYAYDALEPVIDAQTMELHHSKHHQTYVDKLNEGLKDHPELFEYDVNALMTNIHSLPESVWDVVRKHGGGHANHLFFWEIMAPKAGGEPQGELADAITETFGDFASFKTKFADAAKGHFGSGWAWLVVTGLGKLEVNTTVNQISPLSHGHTPILGLDVWEHAYYLKYQNRRPEYVEAWWQLVNWPKVAELYAAAH